VGGIGEVRRASLLLVLDDLQWADTASISLLFHLGRRIEGGRVMMVGAYRPEEVALGRDGERHPLEAALAELKRRFGDVWIDLEKTEAIEGQRLVDELLDSEPNRLGDSFRRALFRHAGGHPLFTIEVLRALQERGDLVRDDEGRWVEGGILNWDSMPVPVEGVIEERIGRLSAELREVLTVASVEGEHFTGQVVARVQETGERQLLRTLSDELEQRHRLVQRNGEALVGGRSLSRYEFAHTLFQRYLDSELTVAEQRLLHRELEVLGNAVDDLTVGAGRNAAQAAKSGPKGLGRQACHGAGPGRRLQQIAAGAVDTDIGTVRRAARSQSADLPCVGQNRCSGAGAAPINAQYIVCHRLSSFWRSRQSYGAMSR
jgi:adenylate cyclase